MARLHDTLIGHHGADQGRRRGDDDDGHDPFGRVTSLTPPGFGAFTTTWGADGQPTSAAAPNGNTTTSGYDALGRLHHHDDRHPGELRVRRTTAPACA